MSRKGLTYQILAESPNWSTLLGEILMNRMGGVAYYTLQQCGLLSICHREFRTSLQAIYDNNCVKAASFKSALAELQKTLAPADFSYALLKGARLVELYPLGLRTSNDIDILVNADDIVKLTNLLKSAGFEQGYLRADVFTPATRAEVVSARMIRGETVPFVKKINLPSMEFLEVDVNFSLNESGGDGEIVRKMLKNARGGWLADDDFVIHLCAHLYKEATGEWWVERKRDRELYKFADLYLTGKPDNVGDRAAELGLSEQAKFAFDELEKLWN